MRHATCRRRLAADPRDSTVSAHLERCPACAAHAERLRTVVDTAPRIVPTPPAGLADRVSDRVAAGVLGGAPVSLAAASPGPARPAPHRAVPALAAAAVVVVALAAGALVLRSDDGTATIATAAPDVALAAATEATAADTFRFTVEGTHRVHVRLPAVPRPGERAPMELPELDVSVPEELLQGMPPELAERMRERLRQASDRMQDRMGSVSVPELRIEPAEHDTTVTLSAEGAVDHPDRARVDGTLVSVGGPSGDTITHELSVVVIDGTVHVRDGDEWVRLAAGNAPLPTPVVDPRASFDALVRRAGPIQDLGLEQLGGETVRHLRVRVPAPEALASGAVAPSRLTPDPVAFTTDVWIGEDDVIRQLRTRGHLGGGNTPVSVDIDLTVRISHVGEPVDIEAPSPARVRDGSFPFGFGFGFFLHLGGT